MHLPSNSCIYTSKWKLDFVIKPMSVVFNGSEARYATVPDSHIPPLLEDVRLPLLPWLSLLVVLRGVESTNKSARLT